MAVRFMAAALADWLTVKAFATRVARAAAYPRYDWTVNDGTLITFNVMDLFAFNVMDLFAFHDGSDKVRALMLIYDTPSIWQTAGNRYED